MSVVLKRQIGHRDLLILRRLITQIRYIAQRHRRSIRDLGVVADRRVLMQSGEDEKGERDADDDHDALPMSRVFEHALRRRHVLRLEDFLHDGGRIDLLAGRWIRAAIRTNARGSIDRMPARRADCTTHQHGMIVRR